MKVETVEYQVNWAKFRPGYSFFIPCIDEDAAKAAVREVTQRLKIDVVMRVTIEGEVKGLRVWRV